MLTDLGEILNEGQHPTGIFTVCSGHKPNILAAG
jgi:hypothetical protein